MHLLKNNIFKVLWASLLQGILIFLCLPGNNLEIMCLFSYIPFFYFRNSFSIKEYLSFGALSGMISGSLMHIGFLDYGYIIYVYSVFLLSLEFFLFTLFNKKYSYFSGILFIVVFEFLRTLGPFAFPANVALSLFKIPLLIGLASFGGIYIITLIILFLNLFLYKSVWINKKNIFVVIMILIMASGVFFIKEDSGEKINVAVVQGSIPIWMYSMEEFHPKYTREITGIYTKLSEEAAKDSDVIIWPETAIHKYIFSSEEYYFKTFFDKLNYLYGTSVIAGTPYKKDNVETNSIVFYSEGDLSVYDKIKTVPIVEDYYKKGTEYKSLGNSKFRFAPVICFESIFERIVLKNSAKNADFIVITTNDAGFKKTIVKDMHLSYSVFRAVENSKSVVRAAQSGISVIISHKGEIIKQSGSFTREILKGSVSARNKNTFFARFYNFIIFMYFLIFILSLLIKRKL